MKTNNISFVLITILFISLLASCSESEPDVYKLYKCYETSVTRNPRTYFMEMRQEKKDKSKFLLSNFYNLGNDGNNDIEIKISDKNITVQPKAFDYSSIQIKSGTGTINNDTSQIEFKTLIFDGTSIIEVKSVLVKQ
ncbi:MAG: hypothetical protein RIS29_2077 [Bacteroidota bacterium]